MPTKIYISASTCHQIPRTKKPGPQAVQAVLWLLLSSDVHLKLSNKGQNDALLLADRSVTARGGANVVPPCWAGFFDGGHISTRLIVSQGQQG